MSSNDYQQRNDLIHDLSVQIDDLLKDSVVLNLQLKSANEEVAKLKVEIVRLENGQIELRVKLENANNEVGRFAIVLNQQAVNLESIQKLGKQM
jgi:hypothetical protein